MSSEPGRLHVLDRRTGLRTVVASPRTAGTQGKKMRRSRVAGFALVMAVSSLFALAPLGAAGAAGSRASVSIVAVDPDLLLPVEHQSVVQVTVQYSIEPFEKGKFFLFPQYRISDERSTSGRLRSRERTYLETASGRAVVECDLSSLEENTEVERPLKLSILLLEEVSPSSGRPIAVSQTIAILTK